MRDLPDHLVPRPRTFPSKQGRFARGASKNETRYSWSSGPTHDISFRLFPPPFFTLLSFAIDICFAIYRHTYRIYLHKLCNTDEPTLPRVGPRTSLLRASHPPFFRPHAHRNGARVVRGASRSHERGFSDHPVRSTLVTPFSPLSPSLSLRIARSLVSVPSCPLVPTSVPYTKNLFTLFSPSLRAPLPAISLSVDYGDFLVFLPFCVFIFFFLQPAAAARLNTISL